MLRMTFIAIECIEDLGIEGLWFSAGMFGKSLYALNSSQGKWVKEGTFNIGMGVELLQKKFKNIFL